MEIKHYVCCFKKDNIRPKLLQLTEAKSEALRSDWRRNLSFSFEQHKTHGSRASMIFVFQSIHVFSLAPCNSYFDLIGCCD